VADLETIRILNEIRAGVTARTTSDLAVTPKQPGLYELAGIYDIAEFYRNRYVSGGILDAAHFDSINRFDIRWARTMWVYDNVRPGSTVLDLGCGAGLLSVLKRKSVSLTGVDISAECCKESLRNKYDAAYVAELRQLPFPDNSFDYVISLDVMGHIEAPYKDDVLGEMKRVLKQNGEVLHGIECLDRSIRKGYEEMTPEELRAYVSVDGHVGMEDQEQIEARFRRYFSHVQVKPRFAVCQPVDELIKQADQYGTPVCEPDLLRYVKTLNANERRAFDIAMGYVFSKISESDIDLPNSEYVFVKASEQKIKKFYNTYRDTLAFSNIQLGGRQKRHVSLDRHPNVSFVAGWYPPEDFPPVGRWMSEEGRIFFRADEFSEIRLDITTHMPDLDRSTLEVKFYLNRKLAHAVTLIETGWSEISIDALPFKIGAVTPTDYELLVTASRTWVPKFYDRASSEERELSIAMCNLELIF
jgi:ubiquinone/menaquinone biosynthesis C-methylase UbiE